MIAVLLAVALAASSKPVVDTTDGPLVGSRRPDGSAAFRGIRYARPPVGHLRWKPPQPIRRHKLRYAIKPGVACPQSEYGDWNRRDAATAREDCLTLEVRTPSLTPSAPLPVMVWIHGGANRAGSSMGAIDSDIVDKGFVFVDFNYRLGPLGFLSHPSLSAESPSRASGNYGLMDQQAALVWIRRNIGRFGGDPDQITLFGGSAGAQDTGLHLLIPGSRRLFARAIQQSGTPGFGLQPRGLPAAEQLGERLARLAGAPRHADVRSLRALSVRRLLQAADRIDVPELGDDSMIWLQMTVDGLVLPSSPERLLAQSEDRRPLIIGSNGAEFAASDLSADSEGSIRRLYGERAAQVLAHYAEGGLRASLPLAASTDLIFRCPAEAVARARSAAGAPVWLYRYDRDGASGEPVRHGSEVEPVLRSSGSGVPPIQAYWLNFARTGDPNGGSLPHWRRYDPARPSRLVFGQDATVSQPAPSDVVCSARSVP